MSLLKNLLFIVSLCFVMKPAYAMYRKLNSRSLMSTASVLKQSWKLQRFSKSWQYNQFNNQFKSKLFNTPKKYPVLPTSTNQNNNFLKWNKFAAVTFLAGAGYGFARSSEIAAEEKNWDELTEEEKDVLAKPYTKGWKYQFNVEEFLDASERDRNIIVYAMALYVKQGNEIDYLDWIYKYLDKHQRDTLLSALVKSLEQGNEIDYLDRIYKYSDKYQRNTLLSAFVKSLEQGKNFHYLRWLHSKLDKHQRDALLPALVKNLEQGENFHYLHWVYEQSDKHQKNFLRAEMFKLLQLELGLDSACLESTQTGNHLKDNSMYCYEYLSTKKRRGLQISKFFKEIIESEKDYIQKGYYLFYHSQRWGIYWLEYLYTKLWELKYKQNMNNYVFTRFVPERSCQDSAQSIDNALKIRKQLKEKGRFDPHRPSLLFANYALFGNITNTGSSSIDYFLNNQNVSIPDMSTRDIFKMFDLESVYIENEDAICELKREFLDLTDRGNLLQIAIPKKHLQKHVYLATSGGSKKQATIILSDGSNKETEDVKELIEVLKTNPEAIKNSDLTEFVWIVTEDTMQKAIEDGCEIKAFNAADQEAFERVTNKLDSLLTVLTSKWTAPELTPWQCYKKYKEELQENEQV